MAFAQAMPGVMQVTLTVTKGNVAATGLYRSLGFQVFGEERNGLFADGIMHDEIHMASVFLSAADVMTHAKHAKYRVPSHHGMSDAWYDIRATRPDK